MKDIACIFITLDRLDHTLRCIRQNFFNAGMSARVYLVDNASTPDNFQRILEAYPFTAFHRFPVNKGISHAINMGIDMAKPSDGYVTMANDILMPDGWLSAMTYHAQRIENTGMAGIHCVEALPAMNELGVHPSFTAFGNVLITNKAVEKIGYFNVDFDPYGMQDGEYAYRLNKTGFINYYIPELKSEHIGHDVGQDSAYRRMKDQGLERAGRIFGMAVERYEKLGDYYNPG